jgi:maleamate amidohydrolase
MKWEEILNNRDRIALNRYRLEARVGFGQRPALICVDCQVYMTGDRDEPMEESFKRFPASCGHAGWAACQQIARLLNDGDDGNIILDNAFEAL